MRGWPSETNAYIPLVLTILSPPPPRDPQYASLGYESGVIRTFAIDLSSLLAIASALESADVSSVGAKSTTRSSFAVIGAGDAPNPSPNGSPSRKGKGRSLKASFSMPSTPDSSAGDGLFMPGVRYVCVWLCLLSSPKLIHPDKPPTPTEKIIIIKRLMLQQQWTALELSGRCMLGALPPALTLIR